MSQNTQSMKTLNYYIYQIYNKITKKSYVGKSVNYKKRFQMHLKNAKKKINRRLYDSINFHGEDNFELILLETIQTDNQKIVNEREIFWIQKLDALIPNGYNMTIGGDGGNTLETWDEERKKELYKKQGKIRGKVFVDPEIRKKAAEKCKLTKMQWSDEKKKELNLRISNTMKEKGIKPKFNPFPKGSEGFFKGKKHTDHTKQKLSEARKGKKLEEIIGNEKAKFRKLELKNSFLGKNNPNYVPFLKQEMLDVLYAILDNPLIMLDELSFTFGKSKHVLRNFLKSIKITNFQTFKQNYNASTILEAINYVNRNY
jgi:group I intron endonuclease